MSTGDPTLDMWAGMLLIFLGFLLVIGIMYWGSELIIHGIRRAKRPFEKDRAEEARFRKRYAHVMKHGTEEEKQTVLLEAQNRKLDGLGQFAVFWWFFH